MNAQFTSVNRMPNPTGAYVVRRPRPTDAVGAALRKAYDGAPGASADLISLVRALDQVD